MRLEVARLLLDRGSDVQATDEEEATALHVACRENYLPVVELLLGKGAATGALDKLHQIPLHLACQDGRS